MPRDRILGSRPVLADSLCPTIYRAVDSLTQPPLPVERVRYSGAGRKTLVEHDPQLVQALEALIDPDTRGDPMSPLRWTCKSTRQLARLLTAEGHPSVI